MKSFIRIGYWFFVTALIAVGSLLAATLFPIPGNYAVKIVQSGSMAPAIQTGSLVVVAPADVYTIGDIITFGEDTREKTPTTHRVTGVRVSEGEYFFTTKGDANEDPDPREVSEREVRGKVLFSVPYAGFLIDFARKPVGFILLVGVPAAVIILDEFGNIWKEARTLRGRGKRDEDTQGKHDHT